MQTTVVPLAETARAAFSADPLQSARALAVLADAPRDQWRREATTIVEVLRGHDLNSWTHGYALSSILGNEGAVDMVVDLLRDPGQASFGLRLAALAGPNEALERELSSFPPTDTVEKARYAVSGQAAIRELIHGIGHAYWSSDVEESIRCAIHGLQRMSPRQLGRLGPRLFEGMRNWESVDGMRDLFFEIMACLNRADPTVLAEASTAWLSQTPESRREWVDWFIYVASCAPHASWVHELATRERPNLQLSEGWLDRHLGHTHEG